MMHEDVEGMDDELASCAETLRMHQEALAWALDVLETSLKRLDKIDGPYSDEHLRIRAVGLSKARNALAGSTVEPPTTCGRDICPPTNDCRICR